MKWRNVPLRTIPVLCLVVFLLFYGNRVLSQVSPKVLPDVNQDSRAVVDPGPAPPSEQQAPIQQHTLSIARTGNGQGRITINPAGNLFKKGTPVTLYAIPDSNSVFEGWSGSCSGPSRTCSVSMTVDRAVTAYFSLKTYTIVVRSPINGVIHPSGMVKANHGEKRRFQIIPLPGYRVSEVLVDKVSAGPVNSYTFNNVTADHVIEAIFLKQ
jgi:hypothetical protein